MVFPWGMADFARPQRRGESHGRVTVNYLTDRILTSGGWHYGKFANHRRFLQTEKDWRALDRKRGFHLPTIVVGPESTEAV
jgi:hypothetical protein